MHILNHNRRKDAGEIRMVLHSVVWFFFLFFFFHLQGLLKRYFSFPLLTINDLKEEGVAIFN